MKQMLKLFIAPIIAVTILMAPAAFAQNNENEQLCEVLRLASQGAAQMRDEGYSSAETITAMQSQLPSELQALPEIVVDAVYSSDLKDFDPATISNVIYSSCMQGE